MNRFTYALIGLFVVLQYLLWFGSGGVLAYWRLQQGIGAQQTENTHLIERNQTLQAEVVDLKSGLDAIEERARAELGMVRRNETFYQVVSPVKR